MRKSQTSRHPHSVAPIFVAALLTVMVSSVSAQIAFEDVSVAAGYGTSASETWGAAWGDVNSDSYPDVFFSNHRNRATLYRNNRNGTFSEVSGLVDVSRSPGWTGGRAHLDTHGATWVDIDNDGDADLVQSVESSTDRLYINEAGRLVDRTSESGLDQLGHWGTRHSLFLDYTGDGRLDLASVALSRPAFSPQLSGGTFGHGATVETPLSCASDGQWAHLVDLHPTAGLELVCAPRNGSYPKVNAFRDGTIVSVTAQYPQYSPVIDVATLDYNGDLRPDLFILRGTERPSDAFQVSSQRFEAQFITAARRTKSVTFKSAGVLTVSASLSAGSDPQGDPAYIDIGSGQWSPGSLVFQLDRTQSRNWGIGTGSPGLNIGYFPATGEWEISQGNTAYSYSYVQVASTAPITGLTFTGASTADRGYKPLFVRNTVNGITAVTTAGFDASLRCQSAVAGDFDNDMDEDIFLACTGGAHNIANRLYMNNGNGTFSEVPRAGGAAGRTGAAVAKHAGTSESVVMADYDRDGFLDLLVTNGNNMRPVYFGGVQQLFRNRGNENRWMQFDLVGTTSNRDGIGARIYITAGGVTQYRERNGGYHRWSQNFQRVHVGLGASTRADVTVEWPDGTSTLYRGLQANRLYRLQQDGTSALVPS